MFFFPIPVVTTVYRSCLELVAVVVLTGVDIGASHLQDQKLKLERD